MENNEATQFRIAMLGSGGVGKTSLILRYLRDKFDETYIPTIQDSFKKNVTINNKNYTIDLIDTAGQDELQAITDVAYANSNAFCIVYSIISQISLSEAENYYNRVKKSVTSGTKPLILLLGNKADLSGDRNVSFEEGKILAEKMQAIFAETSAKTGACVNESFNNLIDQLIQPKTPISQPKIEENQSNGCCQVI